jgi:hypothetical protein
MYPPITARSWAKRPAFSPEVDLIPELRIGGSWRRWGADIGCVLQNRDRQPSRSAPADPIKCRISLTKGSKPVVGPTQRVGNRAVYKTLHKSR